MGTEGWGITVFVLQLILTPLEMLTGGVCGVIACWIIAIIILIKHECMKSGSPDIVMRDFKSNKYSYGKRVAEDIGRELTEEEQKYLNTRAKIYEVAYQTMLRHKRNYLTKFDFQIGVGALKFINAHMDNYGIYMDNYEGDHFIDYVYIIRFPSGFENQEPHMCSTKKHGYASRFLYEKEVNDNERQIRN